MKEKQILTQFNCYVNPYTLATLKRLYPGQVSHMIRKYLDSIVTQNDDDDNENLVELQKKELEIKQKLDKINKKYQKIVEKREKLTHKKEVEEQEIIKKKIEERTKAEKFSEAMKRGGVLARDN